MKVIVERLYTEPALVFGILVVALNAAGLAFGIEWLVAVSTVVAAVGARFTRQNVTPLRNLEPK